MSLNPTLLGMVGFTKSQVSDYVDRVFADYGFDRRSRAGFSRTSRHFTTATTSSPDAETLAQARRYRDSLPSRPGWDFAVETAVVEVYGDLGYRWFPSDSPLNFDKIHMEKEDIRHEIRTSAVGGYGRGLLERIL